MSLPRPIEDFWLAADGNDWAPALNRAQATGISYADSNGVKTGETVAVLFSNRVYTFASKIDVYRRLSLISKASITGHSSTAVDTNRNHCQIYFSGSAGFEVHYPSQFSGATITTTGTYSSDPLCNAEMFHIKGITLVGSGPTSNVTYHGIIAHNAVTLEDVTISGFGGAGVLMQCYTGRNHQPCLGDATGSRFVRCRFQNNGTAGTVLDGDRARGVVFDSCYWNANGYQFTSAAGPYTAATTACYVKRISRAITSSSISNNVLSMVVGLTQAQSGFVVGDYITTTGMQANVDGVQITGYTSTTITCAITAADDTINNAGTLYPSISGNTDKFLTYVFTNLSGGKRIFERGNIVKLSNTTSPGAPYTIPGALVRFADDTHITIEGNLSGLSDTSGDFSDGVGTITAVPCQLVDSSTEHNTYINSFIDNGDSGYGTYYSIFCDESTSKHTFIDTYTNGTSVDVYYNAPAMLIGGTSNINNSFSTTSAVELQPSGGSLTVYKSLTAKNRYPDDSSSGTVSTEVGSTSVASQAWNATDVTTSNTLGLYYNRTSYASLSNSGSGWWELAYGSGATDVNMRLGADTNTRGNDGAVWFPNNGIYISDPTGSDALDATSGAVFMKAYNGGNTLTSGGYLLAIDSTFAITNVSNSGGKCQVTIASGNIKDGFRVWIQGVQGATQANGMWLTESSNTAGTQFVLTGSSAPSTYTSSTGRCSRVQAFKQEYSDSIVTAGALGDVVWNMNPLGNISTASAFTRDTKNISHWGCSVHGSSGAEFRSVSFDTPYEYIHPTDTVSYPGSVTWAPLHTMWKEVDGQDANSDTILILNHTQMGVKNQFRIVEVRLIVTTAIAAATAALYTAANGGGTKLTADFDISATGVVASGVNDPFMQASVVDQGLYLHTSSGTTLAGQLFITYVFHEDS
jgi:hypothetical protein